MPPPADFEPSLPRTLGSYPFSGEDIDYYFQKFFECYHPYMPVVRHRDTNKCYESCPLLFWTIIYVGSRRVTINAALLLGVHTGRGGHPEYSHGVFQNNFTNEEAIYTWAGLNIVSQRVSSFMGLPPVTSLFNQTIQNTILANLEESNGVSSHIVQVLEDEWNIVQGMICSERADDLDRFNALLVRLEIQIFYMVPVPGYSPESLKQHILRTYQTASSALRNAQELDEKIGFLGHITHPQMRSLLTASCVIFKLLRSSYMQFLDRKSIEAIASDTVSICERMSVMEGDLPMRLNTLLKTFLEFYYSSTLATTWQNEEPTVTKFPRRLGAGVMFDCFISWKSDGPMKRGLHQQHQQIPNHPNDGAGEETDTLLPSAVPDSLAIDWSFMDDFEWTWTPPGLAPPVNLWHGMAR
ncbi:hypothetical protein E0Z10_g404 [Xylaria hypoxylon]|uniref:Transcription factor domain-containing protein n=1 Tax=Xylaria hypoxylon TaxID=37992 RepID=A0A4Z0Z7V0_9PEZI|nr:hypothetical protein E0Z10_g404 [Xylaria hypoxylon]